MIPWTHFDHVSHIDTLDTFRPQLQEQWLQWIDYGPSMATAFVESPMLELAHERQFVSSQSGGDSAGFEHEHTRRIDECLTWLDHFFHLYPIDGQCHPDPPCSNDLLHCWIPDLSLSSLPPLSLDSDEVLVVELLPSVQPVILPLTSPSTSNPDRLLSTISVRADIDVGESSDDTWESVRQMIRDIPRARKSLPVHGVRANKPAVQRKRCSDKLSTESSRAGQKRSSQWMGNHHNNNNNNNEIAKRKFLSTSCRAAFDTATAGNVSPEVFATEWT